MHIDGLLDEPAWQKAQVLSFFVPPKGEKPLVPTRARILWDDQYLYVGFKAYDKDVWSYLTERDVRTWSEDVLEIFLKPNLKKEPYADIEINAQGAVYDSLILKRKAGGDDNHRWDRWNIEGIKVGITVGGTMNNPNDVDKYWQMEVAIPYSGIPILKGRTPKAGDEWQVSLSRYDYSVYLPKGQELTASAPLSILDFHEIEDFSTMKFAK